MIQIIERAFDQSREPCIVTQMVVMEENQAFHVRVQRNVDSDERGRVAPVAFLEGFDQVVKVSVKDERVGISEKLDEFSHRIGVRSL